MKNMKTKTAALLIVLIAAWSGSRAEGIGYREDFLYLEAGWGPALTGGRGLERYARDQYFYLDRYIASFSRHKERLELALARTLASPEPRSRASAAHVRLEYGFAKRLSLGGALNMTDIEMRGIQALPNRLVGMMVLALPVGPNPADAPFGFEYAGLMTGKLEFAPARTVDFEVGWHPLGDGALDPYLRANLGVGPYPGGGQVRRAGAMFGLRYFFQGGFHLALEAHAGQITFPNAAIKNGGYQSADLYDSLKLVNERGIRLAAGITI